MYQNFPCYKSELTFIVFVVIVLLLIDDNLGLFVGCHGETKSTVAATITI
jgi:hypothetical protein